MKKQITKKITIELSDMWVNADANKEQNVVCIKQKRYSSHIPFVVYLTKSQIEKIYKESMKLFEEND